MKSPKQIGNAIQTSPHLYEPTSVLDHHLTFSPAAATTAPTIFTQNAATSDYWDPLSFFDTTESSSFISSLDLSDLDPPPFDKFHLDLLLKAATSIESNDLSAAHSILSRLNQTDFDSTANTTILSPLLRVAFHFKDALLSLLPIPHPVSPLLPSRNRDPHHRPQVLLRPLPRPPVHQLHRQPNPARGPSRWLPSGCPRGRLRHRAGRAPVVLLRPGVRLPQQVPLRPPPRIRITAIVPDETVLAAENQRDFARTVGVHLTVGFVHVSTLGTLALGRVRVQSGEAVGVVLTPNVFRLVGGTHESRTALLRFVKQVSPNVVVFVDTECYEASSSFRRSFATGLEFYSTVLESVYAAAAGSEAVRRVEKAVIRPKVFGAVAGWVPRDMTWQEVLGREGFGMVGFSEFTESQAEWLLRLGPVEGFQVARRDGAMVLIWRGREVATTSAWRC